MTTDTAAGNAIDVRSLEPRLRHSTIFAAFDALELGQALQIVNDHDPRPLYFQLQSRSPESFTWQYLESGPQTWRVAIERTKAAGQSGSGCCGGCGGGCA